MRTAGYILIVAVVASCAASANANWIANGDFSAPLAPPWHTEGKVTIQAGQAVLEENPVAAITVLSRQFVIPAGAQSLSFTHSVDPPEGSVPNQDLPDALLVYLYDLVTGNPILATPPPGGGRSTSITTTGTTASSTIPPSSTSRREVRSRWT